jgi:ubiquinone/menaquinone biosynthesis C-methylase UbiE
MMTFVDPFGRTDKLDPLMLDVLVARFEARGKHPQFSKMLMEYLDAMDIDSTNMVLDIGCGTGLAARAIVHRSGFLGRVVGIDLSSHLIAAAVRLVGEEGVAERIEFRTGNASNLDFADGSFDAIVIHTLLSHIDNPVTVLKEAARVVKVGGVIGIFDGDYASLTFDHPDPAKGKAYDEALISAVVTNPRVMRQMPRLLRAVGLKMLASFSYNLSEVGTANFWSSAVEAYRKLIPKAGVMSEDEADAWAAALRSDSEAGVFFGSSNYYSYIAKRL